MTGRKQEHTVVCLNYSNFPSEAVEKGHLRPWQIENHKKVLSSYRQGKRVFVTKAVTGSGKSKFARALSASMHKKHPKMRTLFVVPKCNIGRGFAGGTEVVHLLKAKLTLEGIARDDQLHEATTDKVDKLKSFLLGDTCSRTGVTTHACLAAAWAQMTVKERSRVKDLFLVIDEVHHAKGETDEDESTSNRLGDFTNHIIEFTETYNYFVLGLTATPFRTDGAPVFEGWNEAPDYKYTAYNHLKSNQHLRSFLHRFHVQADSGLSRVRELLVDPENSGGVILTIPTKAHSLWEDQDNLETTLNGICDPKQWERDDERPYLIHAKIGKKEKLLLDLVSPDTQDAGTLYLSESEKSTKLPKVDIMIQVKVFSEGSDWSRARTLILLGQCQSLVTMIQMAGRVMRDDRSKKAKPAILHHVLPCINFESDVAGSLNNILKSLSIALALGAVNCSVAEVKGVREGGQPGVDWREIIETSRKSDSEIFLRRAFKVAQDFRAEGGNADMSVREQNEFAISNLERYLSDNNIPQAREVAEGMVRHIIRRGVDTTIKKIGKMNGIDVNDIDIDILGTTSVYDGMIHSTGHRTFKHAHQEIERLGNLEWNTLFKAYFKFCKDEGRTPSKEVEGEEGRLSNWANTQRQAQNTILKYRKDLLNSQEGWSWDVFGDSWKKFIVDLKHFVNTEKKWPYQGAADSHEKYLGLKVGDTKQDIKKGIHLNEWQEQMMLIPGFELDVLDARWDRQVLDMDEYWAKHGNVPTAATKLGSWVSETRKRIANGTIPDIYRAKVEGKPWLWHGSREHRFDEGYNHLKEFYRVNKRLPQQREKSPDGYRVGPWMHHKRQYRAKLTEDRVSQLRKIPGALPE